MSTTAISQANGADLLNLYAQSSGAASAATTVEATANVLKKALTEAQLNASEILGTGGDTSGTILNVLA